MQPQGRGLMRWMEMGLQEGEEGVGLRVTVNEQNLGKFP